MTSRIHPKYKTKYRVWNWRAYERALVQRGDVTLWLSVDATAAWIPSPSGRPGGQQRFSDLAIETALSLRLVLRLPLRQTEGFLRSLLALMRVELGAPDHTTLSRRSRRFNVELHRIPANGPIHLVVDSTGLSIVGEGESATAEYGGHGQRGWKKLYLGVDRLDAIVASAFLNRCALTWVEWIVGTRRAVTGVKLLVTGSSDWPNVAKTRVIRYDLCSAQPQKEGSMGDDRSIAVKQGWLALGSLALVVVMACGGGGAPAAEGDMAATMETETGMTGAGPGSTGDLVPRQLPNPTGEVTTNWAPLPDGRRWGSTAGIDIGPDGHVWAYDRCGGGLDGGCETNPELDPIFKFDKDTGEILTSFGAGLFVTPHGFHVDDDGNVWATDFAGNEAGTKGHQVIKFSPDGEVLLRLGEAGVPGSGPGQLNQPCDVITAPNGDIFVSDGHSGQGANPPPGSTGRILKFDSEGNFIKEWGEIGFRPGQFRTPHAMEFDSQGRLYVADRGNHRIQVFDQDGNAILDENGNPEIYMNYSRVSGLFITDDDTLYAIDSESGVNNHPGWLTGVRIGPANEDRLTGFVPPHAHDVRVLQGVAGEGVAVDADGNVYAAEGPGSRPTAGGGITKYVRK